MGSDGTILKSDDGGETWEARPSGTDAALFSVTFSADGQSGWAVGRDGTILKSDDRGETWEARPSGTGAWLRSVTFSADGQSGWAVGRDGTILKSDDRGETWEARPSGTGAWLRSVTFSADGQSDWAVGSDGTILKSDDGGETWEARPSGTGAQLRSVTFSADGQSGWAVGRNGTILKSDDGGETWEARPSGTGAQLRSVTFSADGQSGWAVGDGGTILKSDDGGETWEARASGTAVWLESVTFSADRQSGWAVGRDGTILKSDDGGETWEARASGTAVWLESVTFSANGESGWAVGDGGTILKSDDGGETWEARASGTAVWLRSVTFSADGQSGWAVGDGGTILKSDDRGETWEARPSGTGAWLRSVTFSADGQSGWAVGRDGTILKSDDRGETWEARPSGTGAWLRSVTFSADGQSGWAVGRDGTILKSDDRGETWEARPSGTDAWLRTVTFSADGKSGWAVGRDGTILQSDDGGETWEARASGTAVWLESVTFSADGQSGWAVGRNTILRTVDGGENWRLLNAKDDYRKYPAPWTWILFMLVIPALLPLFRHPPPVVQAERIADHFVSDRPINADEPDPLQRRSIAGALSRFLRNDNTEPPLTVAITGDWGEGKSSLMNLVQADLKKHGTSTVWFNAWHHQKERHLFAALLQAVRDQAIPPVWTFRGLEFRYRLVLSRAKQHRVWAMVALLLLGLSAGALGTDSSLIANMIKDAVRLATHLAPSLDSPLAPLLDKNNIDWIQFLSNSIPGSISTVIVLNSGIASLRRSAANPGRLLAATSGAFRVRRFGEQLGFRHRFGNAFKEVAEALRPNTLLILIDDLDRCRPEQVVDILEAMNFLVSAGRCYIVIGIAPEQVMHCVGLGFKEIAAEMAEIPNNGDDSEVRAREKRRVYARSYLEKLINIEIPIPKLTPTGAEQLVASESAMERGELRRTLRHFAKIFAVCLAILLFLAVGVYLGSRTSSTAAPDTDSGQPSNVAATQSRTPSNQTQDPNDTPELVIVRREGSPGPFQEGGKNKVPWWSSHLPAWSFVFAAVIATALFVWRRQQSRIQDSPDFTEALKIWHPLIRATTNSPRQMKRFMNRVRYLAMASSVSIANMKLSESQLVALSTLQGLKKDDVLAALKRAKQGAKAETESDEILRALCEHSDKFHEEVTKKHLTNFHEIASGIVVH